VQFLKILLSPLSFCYGLVTALRNFLYDKKILDSEAFPVPVISVGNLTTGGTGKSPMIEYLIRLLETKNKIATLSRGYGRKSKGFLVVEESFPVDEAGDEPKLFKTKFPSTLVTVGENRISAIGQMLSGFPDIKVILLDDAFQHRQVHPSLNILLIDLKDVFKPTHMLPSGRMREWKSGMKRADILVVTKCPQVFSPIEQRRCEEKLKPNPNQKLFFSSIRYGELISVSGKEKSSFFNTEYYFSRKFSILLFTGIANPMPLCDYLEEHTEEVVHMKFNDHHSFSAEDLKRIKEKFEDMGNKNKIMLTTEKDMVRLGRPELKPILQTMPVFYIPIETKFHQNNSGSFDKSVLTHIQSFKESFPK
jgi:tetraacyldisaccharide 4'-kinase